ncbi:unnamed protein product [Dovyalis caffra]|uniref:pectinesterase n=1 Tax=Dovyalis caffra TaxID=77055 RepID=A0AAV1SR83_9ROSI|nr:unnamed protein product [Dovyalis caffra]
MASILSFCLLLFLSLSITTETNCEQPTEHKRATQPEIVQACKATRFQDTCVSSMSNSNVPKNETPLQIIRSAISISEANLKTDQSMVKSILDTSKDNANRTRAAKTCVETLENSQYRITRTTEDGLPGNTKNARAWMSAALLYQNVCLGQLKYVNDTSLTNQTMSFLNATASLTSNALSMIVSYDVFGNDTKSWGPPQTERDGFWEISGTVEEVGLRYRGGFPPNLTTDVMVSMDGNDGGCYKTVQEAVNTAPDNEWGRRYVIRIKEEFMRR